MALGSTGMLGVVKVVEKKITYSPQVSFYSTWLDLSHQLLLFWNFPYIFETYSSCALFDNWIMNYNTLFYSLYYVATSD